MKEIIIKLVDSVENGHTDALDAYLELKEIEKLVTQSRKQIEEDAIGEAEKYGQKTFEKEGFEITVKSAPGRYSFNGLPDWEKTKTELKEVEERHKQALKLSEKGQNLVTEDGEVVEPAKYTPGKTILSVKTKK